MATTKIGSWLRSLGSGRAAGSDSRNDVDLSALQEACDRLTAQLDDESLSRTELMRIASGLEPIRRQMLHLLEEAKGKDGHARATRLGEEALQQVDACLYSIQPFRPYILPEPLRHKLRRALTSLDSALIALRWAQVQAGAA